MAKKWQSKMVALVQPEIKEIASGLQLDAASQDFEMAKQKQQWIKLEVAESATDCTQCAAGDKVYVPFDRLKMCSVVDYGDGPRIIIHERDILFTW